MGFLDYLIEKQIMASRTAPQPVVAAATAPLVNQGNWGQVPAANSAPQNAALLAAAIGAARQRAQPRTLPAVQPGGRLIAGDPTGRVTPNVPVVAPGGRLTPENPTGAVTRVDPARQREGIGTSWGAYGQPESAAIRRGEGYTLPRAEAGPLLTELLPALPQPGRLERQRFLEANLPQQVSDPVIDTLTEARARLARDRSPEGVAALATIDAGIQERAALLAAPGGRETVAAMDRAAAEQERAAAAATIPALSLAAIRSRDRSQAAPMQTSVVDQLVGKGTVDPEYADIARAAQGELLTEATRTRTAVEAATELQGPEAMDRGMAWFDKPRQELVERVGENAIDRAMGQEPRHGVLDLVPILGSNFNPTAFNEWAEDPENAELIRVVAERGFDAPNGQHFTGGRAVWEAYASGQPWYQRIVNDLVYDPLTYTPAVAKVGTLLKTVPATGKTAAALRVAGTVLQATDLPGQIMDAPITAATSAARQGLADAGVPLLSHLAQYSPNARREQAEYGVLDALRVEQGLTAVPGAPRTDTGAITRPMPPQLPPGSLGSTPVTRLPPGPNAAPTYGPIAQPATNQATPYGGPPALPQGTLPPPGTPNPRILPTGTTAIELPAVTPPPPVAAVPERKQGRFTYLGDRGQVRVYEISNGRARVEERVEVPGKRARWNMVGETESVEAGVERGRTRARGEALPETPAPAAAPTTTPPAASAAAPSTTLPETPAAPDVPARTAAPPVQRMRDRAPLRTRADDLAERSPELAAARDRFVTEAMPNQGRQQQRRILEQADYDGAPPEVKRQIRLEQVTDDIEAAVDRDLPAFTRNFPGEAVDPATMVTEKRYLTGGKKRSFADENDRWLAQAYVYEGTDEALAVLRGKPGVTPEVVRRLEAARAAVDDLLPGQRWSQVPPPASGRGVGLVSPAVQRFVTRDGPLSPPPPVRQPDPNPVLPPDVERALNQTFTSADTPAYTGKTVRQVNQEIILPEVERDLAEYRRLAEQGYSSDQWGGTGTPEVKRRGERVRVQTGEKPVGKSGKTKPVYEWRHAEMLASDPNEAMAAIERKYHHGPPVDLMTVDARDLATRQTARVFAHDQAPRAFRSAPLGLDLIDAVIRRTFVNEALASPLFSWGYTGANLIGNATMTALRTKRAPDIGAIVSDYRAMRRGGDGGLVADDLAAELGYLKGPAQLAPTATVLDPMGPGRTTPTRQMMTGALRLPARKVAGAYDWKRTLDARLETAMKAGGAFVPIARGKIAEARSTLIDGITDGFARRGVAVDRQTVADAIWRLRGANGGFTPNQVYDAILALAKREGYDEQVARGLATRASRDWTSLSRQAWNDAIHQTNRIFPSRQFETNADRYLSYVSLFHFWASRAAVFVAEEFLRDPRAAVWWYRANEGVENTAKEDGYPESVTGLLAIGKTAFGFALYADPAAMFLVRNLAPERMERPDPEGNTDLGRALLGIKKRTGFGPTPFLDGLLNVSGVYGDTFQPNLFPVRSFEIAGAALDVILTQQGQGMGTPVYDQVMEDLRGLASGVVPGTTHVPAGDATAYRTDLVRSMVVGQNDDLRQRLHSPDAEMRLAARQELDAILQNEDDPRYRAAEEAVAAHNLWTRVVNAESPVKVTGKIASREAAIEGNRAASAKPYETWTAADQAASDLRDDITATNESRTLTLEQEGYREIGTERQQKLHQYWTAIAFGEVGDEIPKGSTLVIRGMRIAASDLVAMTRDERTTLADEWLRSVDGTGELDQYRTERDAYVAAHPATGTYEQYKDAVYAYTGGPAAFRAALIAESDHFARAVADRERFIGDVPAAQMTRELDRWTVSEAGYQAASAVQKNLYDPQPLDDGAGWKAIAADDTVLRGGTGSSGGGGGTSRLDRLTEDLAEYELARGIFIAATGTAPEDVAWNRLVVAGYEADGIWPEASQSVRLYLGWASLQPPGADASPAAYDAYLDELAARPAA